MRKCEPIFNIYNFRIFDGICGTQFEPSLLLSIYKFLTKIQNSWRTIIFKVFLIWNFFGFLSLHCPTLVGAWLSTKMWMWLNIKTLFKHVPILCFNLGCKPKARITKVSILVVALCMSIPLLICSCMMALEIKVLKINIIFHQYWRQIKQILQLQNIITILVVLN